VQKLRPLYRFYFCILISYFCIFISEHDFH